MRLTRTIPARDVQTGMATIQGRIIERLIEEYDESADASRVSVIFTDSIDGDDCLILTSWDSPVTVTEEI